jgi:hypothetical protein
MRNKVPVVLATLLLALIACCSNLFAEEKGEVYHVDIDYDTSGLHISPCPLPGIAGDTWRITNCTSDSVRLFIPVCVGKRNPYFYALAVGDSVDHVIGAWDAGLRVMLPQFAGCGRIHAPSCPALTPLGSLSLVALLTVTAVWILLKKRRQLAGP